MNTPCKILFALLMLIPLPVLAGETHPGGSNLYVQWNNNGYFGGDTNFRYDPNGLSSTHPSLDVGFRAISGVAATIEASYPSTFGGLLVISETIGSGTVMLTDDGSGDGQINLYSNAGTGGFFGLKAPSSGAGTVWALPTADGSSGQVMTTDGAGHLSFAAVTGLNALTKANNIANAILEFGGL